jgi:hypothetical protein
VGDFDRAARRDVAEAGAGMQRLDIGRAVSSARPQQSAEEGICRHCPVSFVAAPDPVSRSLRRMVKTQLRQFNGTGFTDQVSGMLYLKSVRLVPDPCILISDI